MKLQFTKMQGAGNDFVVLDAFSQSLDVTPALARRLADRHFGVGADQVLVVESPLDPSADFRYRIFNNDGSEVEQCGNGARCFARFVYDAGLTRKKVIRVETLAGTISPSIQDDGRVTVDMGPPILAPEKVPFDAAGLQTRMVGSTMQFNLPFVVNGQAQEAWLSVASMGNPHAVLLVDDVDTAPVHSWGPIIENHPRFPARVNVGFLQIINSDQAKLRVWERGSGETLACGTGTCAAAVTGISMGHFSHTVNIQKRGGLLTIAWSGNPSDAVMMTGPAETVFHGDIEV